MLKRLPPSRPRHASPHLQKFDSDDATQRLGLDAFIRGCLFLQTAARAFAAFDPGRTGSITTNFSQFVYCASHVRRLLGPFFSWRGLVVVVAVILCMLEGGGASDAVLLVPREQGVCVCVYVRVATRRDA